MLKADHVYRYQMMRIHIALPETIVSATRIQTVQDIVAAVIVTVSIDFDRFFHSFICFYLRLFFFCSHSFAVPFGLNVVLCTSIFSYLHLIIINYANWLEHRDSWTQFFILFTLWNSKLSWEENAHRSHSDMYSPNTKYHIDINIEQFVIF